MGRSFKKFIKENKFICEKLQGSGVIKSKSSKQGVRNISPCWKSPYTNWASEGRFESGYVLKQYIKSNYVNGEYDSFDFTALLLHCPQNTLPYNRIAIARRQRLKHKALSWVGKILHYRHPFYNLTNKDYVVIISFTVWKM